MDEKVTNDFTRYILISKGIDGLQIYMLIKTHCTVLMCRNFFGAASSLAQPSHWSSCENRAVWLVEMGIAPLPSILPPSLISFHYICLLSPPRCLCPPTPETKIYFSSQTKRLICVWALICTALLWFPTGSNNFNYLLSLYLGFQTSPLFYQMIQIILGQLSWKKKLTNVSSLIPYPFIDIRRFCLANGPARL